MILQSLVKYYETMASLGMITKPGWCETQVSYGLELSEEGELLAVHPLKKEVPVNRKTNFVTIPMTVPQMELVRSTNIKANFLCDNSMYLLGLSNDRKPSHILECFAASKRKHTAILGKLTCPAAHAVVRFFDTWDPRKALENALLAKYWEDILAGGKLVFYFEGSPVHENPEVIAAWESSLTADCENESGKEICLVTGERARIARIHYKIRGVPGATMGGPSLISCNAPAFTFYGKTQGSVSPVGEYAMYAYTTSLSHLLMDKAHTSTVGDMLVVYWAENGSSSYQDAFSAALDPSSDTAEILGRIFSTLASGGIANIYESDLELDMGEKFYVLGLSPNTSRLAIQFFYENEFGNILNRIREHYKRLEIVRPSYDERRYIGPWDIMMSTVNAKAKDKTPIPSTIAGLYRAILEGTPYPETLFYSTMRRIFSEQDSDESNKISANRVAIIKAYLIHNHKEEIDVALNESCNNVAYVLGREFAMLELIQKRAVPDIQRPIKDLYFNAACTTPERIFPLLFKRVVHDLSRIKDESERRRFEIALQKMQALIEIKDEQSSVFPKQLSRSEQGMFVVGYYQEIEKFYTPRHKENK